MLVTNVGQGYGRAIALAYGRAGYDVVCADRDVDLASKTAAELEELGGQAIPIQADMTTHMDVLAAYEKVMEIFGELGGVVHLATHVSSTAFENLGEGEFFELMSEDVRSTYLVLKAAARLRSVGWVAVVAPPALGSVQMLSVQGALEKMIEGFTQRYAFPRANLVVPSRQASDRGTTRLSCGWCATSARPSRRASAARRCASSCPLHPAPPTTCCPRCARLST